MIGLRQKTLGIFIIMMIIFMFDIISLSQTQRENAENQISVFKSDSVIIRNQKEITESINSITKNIYNERVANKLLISITITLTIILLILTIYLLIIVSKLKHYISVNKINNKQLNEIHLYIQGIYKNLKEIRSSTGHILENIAKLKDLNSVNMDGKVVESEKTHRLVKSNQLSEDETFNVKYSNERHQLYKADNSDYFYIKKERGRHLLYVKDSILQKPPDIIYDNEFKKVFRIDDKAQNIYKLIKPSVLHWNYSEKNGNIIELGLIEK